MFKKILFDSLGKRREELDAHSRFLVTAFFPVPDNECRNFDFMATLNRKYHIHVSACRGRGLCVDEHPIHRNILAAGNQIIACMDEINSEVDGKTLDNSSVACCHSHSPNAKVFPSLNRSLVTTVSLLQY